MLLNGFQIEGDVLAELPEHLLKKLVKIEEGHDGGEYPDRLTHAKWIVDFCAKGEYVTAAGQNKSRCLATYAEENAHGAAKVAERGQE